jgi:ankyrin repeat protein
MIDEKGIEILRQKFADLVNYADFEEPIDPLTYVAPDGDTCLHIAALRGDEEAVKLLLDAGIDIHAKGDMGNTALHYAFMKKHFAVAALLIGRGASEDIKNGFGKTPREMT